MRSLLAQLARLTSRARALGGAVMVTLLALAPFAFAERVDAGRGPGSKPDPSKPDAVAADAARPDAPSADATKADGGAAAAKAITIQLVIMHATQADGGGSIDPHIGKMPHLTKPPFSAFNTYKLLDRLDIQVTRGRSTPCELVNGRTMHVTLQDVTSEGRFLIGAAINQVVSPTQPPGLRKIAELSASPGEPFFVAGLPHQGGILVIGFTVKP